MGNVLLVPILVNCRTLMNKIMAYGGYPECHKHFQHHLPFKQSCLNFVLLSNSEDCHSVWESFRKYQVSQHLQHSFRESLDCYLLTWWALHWYSHCSSINNIFGMMCLQTQCIFRSLLTPRSRVLLEKLIITQIAEKFHTFYGTQGFINVFTKACHWSLSWARQSQSTPSYSIFLRFILVLSSHLFLGLPKWSLLFRFSNQNTVAISHLFHVWQLETEIDFFCCSLPCLMTNQSPAYVLPCAHSAVLQAVHCMDHLPTIYAFAQTCDANQTSPVFAHHTLSKALAAFSTPVFSNASKIWCCPTAWGNQFPNLKPSLHSALLCNSSHTTEATTSSLQLTCHDAAIFTYVLELSEANTYIIKASQSSLNLFTINNV